MAILGKKIKNISKKRKKLLTKCNFSYIIIKVVFYVIMKGSERSDFRCKPASPRRKELYHL